MPTSNSEHEENVGVTMSEHGKREGDSNLNSKENVNKKEEHEKKDILQQEKNFRKQEKFSVQVDEGHIDTGFDLLCTEQLPSDDEYESSGYYTESSEYSKTEDVRLLPAMDMARITFRGEKEFREKISVEITNNIEKELSYLGLLLQSASHNGEPCLTYSIHNWSDWIRTGPETLPGTSLFLIRKKQRLREYLILSHISKRLEWKGYNCSIASTQSTPDGPTRDFLYIQWSDPKPEINMGCFAVTFRRAKRFFIVFFFSLCLCFFLGIFIFFIYIMVTRWEKLDLL